MTLNRNQVLGLLAAAAFAVAGLVVVLNEDFAADAGDLRLWAGFLAVGLGLLALATHLPPRIHR